ncbi:MAG TPA: DMT family transporter [Pseudobdellovibrionaceae bacterium]|jgi:uncharacterized membrane protein YdcZ (DUF606 family)
MIKFFLPIIAGISIVLQGTLNRNSTTYMGLTSAVLLNAIVFLFFSIGAWVLFKLNLIGGSANSSVNPLVHFQWWYILPGIFGCLIVFSTPLAIKFLGANSAFAIIICTQLVVSMLWDFTFEKTTPTAMSLTGVVIMIVGLFVLMAGKK